MIYRQGDVIIQRVDAMPAQGLTQVEKDNGRTILAYGEVTGHAHAVQGESVSLYELIDSSDVAEMRDRFLTVEEDAAVVSHEEHAPIDLPAGTYKITIQREYSPEGIRNVAD